MYPMKALTAKQPDSGCARSVNDQQTASRADDDHVTIRSTVHRVRARLLAAALAIVVSAPLAVGPAIAQDNEPRQGATKGCSGDGTTDADESSGAPTKNDKKKNAGEAGSQDPAEPCEPEPQQVSLANLVSPAPAAVDRDLQAALATVGFLDTWYSVTPTHPRLSLVAVTSPASDAARQIVLDLIDELVDNRETTTILLNASQDAVAQRRAVVRTIESIDETLVELKRDRDAAEERLATLEDRLAEIVAAIQNAAVGAYVAENAPGTGSLSDIQGYNERQELVVQVGATLDELLLQRSELEDAIDSELQEIADLNTAMDLERDKRFDYEARASAIEANLALLSAEITDLTMRRIEVEQGFPQVIGDAHKARLLATAPALNVSLVTLDAYVQAADDVGAYYPQCQIRWEILAGIARVESAHSTFGGASVTPNGDVSRRILGPLLDGTLEGTAIIVDTDGGALDGNTEFDAAVGPFQFIPGTWRGYALDATGDGFADPHNLYDGALSAAGYLCASSTLSDDRGIARSVLSYNHSQAYLSHVTGFARSYVLALALPETAYDPETIDPQDGWGVHFEEVDPFAKLGQVAPVNRRSEPAAENETLAITGN